MARDLDFIRELLLAVEGLPAGEPLNRRAVVARGLFAGRTTEDVAYHVDLLADAGYVVGDADTSESGGYTGYRVQRMTMAGHDYLDSVRDPEVYRQTKEKLKKVGGTAALEVVKATAQGIVKGLLGLP